MLAAHEIGAGREIPTLVRRRHQYDGSIRRARLAANQLGLLQRVELTTHRRNVHLRDPGQCRYRNFIDCPDRSDHLHRLLRERQSGSVDERISNSAAGQQTLELTQRGRDGVVRFSVLVDLATLL